MAVSDLIIRDSSFARNTEHLAAHEARDPSIRMGIVRESYQAASGAIKYVVEIQQSNVTLPIVCSLMTRWGGTQNFEEYGLRPYHGSDATDIAGAANLAFDTRVGDMVIVACIQGNYREGVILGGVRHPSRQPKIKAGDIAYHGQFNGVETIITDAGAYRITNRGVISTPLDVAIPGAPILPEVINPAVAGSFYELGNDGSFTASDNMLQSIKIDKTGQTINVTSGKCTIKLDAIGGSLNVDAPQIKISSVLSTDITTKVLNMEAVFSAKLKAKKIAIGNDAFELIDGLVKLIDAFGSLIVMSPNGPCNPLQNAATWVKVAVIKAQLTALKGSL